MIFGIKDTAIAAAVDEVILSIQPLNPWIYHVSRNDSVYIKFDVPHAPVMGTLRIADHPNIKKYRYKWNIIIGYTGRHAIKDRGVCRYFYSETKIGVFAAHILKYRR